MKGKIHLSLAVLLTASFTTVLCAQDSGSVPIRLALSHQGVPAGGEGGLAVIFQVPPDHHITGIETGLFFLEINPPAEFNFGEPVFPQPVDFEGEVVYQGSAPVIVRFSVEKDAVPGEYKVDITYGYQICSETGSRICYLPQMGDTSLTLPIIPLGITPIPAHEDIFISEGVYPERSIDSTPRTLEDRFTYALERGSIVAFLLVFIAGILASLTPCVYPVIPIAIGYIGGRAGGKRLTGFLLSIFLVLGLATVYSVLGLIAAATGSVFGAYTQHPVVFIVVAIIFVAMGSSMLGLFEISLPASIQGKMQTQRKGFLGAYLVGMVTGVVAAPCVGPVIVALLAWVAQTGNMLVGFLLMFVFALGMGMLFIVIGTFAGAMSALPGSGKWMETVKKAFGVILIGGALLFLKPLLPEGLYNLLWGILLISVGIFSGAMELVSGEASTGKKWGRVLGVILLIVGVVFFIEGFKSSFGFGERNPSTASTERVREGIEWIVNDTEKAFIRAESSGGKVLMDFYADWCAACRELDEKTWVDPNLVAESADWIFLKIDLTKITPKLRAIQSEYQVWGMPTVIFFDSSGREIDRFSGFKPAREVLKMMNGF